MSIVRTTLIAVLAFAAGFGVSQRMGRLDVGVLGPPQQKGRGFGRVGARGQGQPQDIGFALLDRNSDGTISEDEISSSPTTLGRLDTDSDGKVTSEEIQQFMPQRGGRGGRGGGFGPPNAAANEMVQTLMGFDANNDGKLSKAEVPGRMQGILDRGDADKDGFLSRAEVAVITGAQASPLRGGPGPGANPFRSNPLLAPIDTNGDGALSADEIRNAPKALTKLDKNGDGKLSREEANPFGSTSPF